MAVAALHPHLDSGNLLPLLAKFCSKPGRKLSQFHCNRAAVGVDDDFALLEIGDMCAR